MTCPSCRAAEETSGLSPQYNSIGCQFCAARHIKRIGALSISKSEAVARQRAVLAGAVGWGHCEKTIREMVKSGPYHAPLAVKKKKG